MEKKYYPQLKETVYETTLTCGLRVILVPRPGFRKKLAYFATNFGAIDTRFMLDGEEVQVPEGIAHFLEHKMFDMPGQRDINEEFAALGAFANAFTSYYMTAYQFSCTNGFYESLRLLLEFVSTPYFTRESVDKEQGIIGQEIGIYQDNPEAKCFENLTRISYSTHPVREPILGTVESIAKITPEMLHLCHKAFYHPENMLLCVIGDIDPQALCRVAEEALPPRERPNAALLRDWQEPMTTVQAEILDHMDVARPVYSIGFKCEPVGDGFDMLHREIVGDLAAEALIGESSELYLRLYEKNVIGTSFGCGFDTMDGMAQITMGGEGWKGKIVLREICKKAEELAREGIPEEDFLRLKRSAMGQRIRGLDKFDATNFRICAYYFSNLDYFRFPEAYQQVTREEVQEFIRRVFVPERATLSVILPNVKEEEEENG